MSVRATGWTLPLFPTCSVEIKSGHLVTCVARVIGVDVPSGRTSQTVGIDDGIDDGIDTDDAVCRALADRTRRSLLEALFDTDGQTVQALCDRHPEMTRFGVMTHLAIFAAANSVVTRREGRRPQRRRR